MYRFEKSTHGEKCTCGGYKGLGANCGYVHCRKKAVVNKSYYGFCMKHAKKHLAGLLAQRNELDRDITDIQKALGGQ